MANRGKIIVQHFVGQMPLAGIAWQAIQYILGLERLGFETWYIEDGGANPYDPRIDSVVMECAYNVAYVRKMMERYGLGGRWAYWDAINDVYHGLARDKVRTLYRDANALINLCGATRLREEHMACPIRIMVDTDPVYEQIRYAKADNSARLYLDAHTHFFTYGENLGSPDCPIDLSGLDWRPTRPPIVLSEWPAAEGAPSDFTTIATWENKGKNIEFGGETYVWSKHVNFVRFFDLPQQAADQRFTMAILTPSAQVTGEIESHGWRVIDPRPISADMDTYRTFIQNSRGEFTVAKDIYVRPNSGWFSDRSACYLASGRPVVTMKTGFNKFYPAGEGLFQFTTMEEALEALRAINGDYARHANAARRIAADFFASDDVLSSLTNRAGL